MLTRNRVYFMKNKIIGILCFFSFFLSAPLFANNTMGASTPKTALKNMYSLNPEMFSTLSEQEQLYQQKLLQHHPIIVALFSPTGGQFVLYRPGQKPLVASPLPDAQDYQLATVVEHAAMETYALAIQGLNNPQNLVWQTKMKAYQLKLTLAQQSVDFLEALPAQKEQYRSILKLANSFIAENLRHNSLSLSRTNEYAKSLEPYFTQVSKIVISNQVNHWISIVATWKKLLGNDWDNTYGAIMYINAQPKNNIFLHILAQSMGQEVIGNRLFNFTANSYTPTTDQALELLAKATPDKNLANNVFGEYYLSYSQILGKTARNIMGEKEE